MRYVDFCEQNPRRVPVVVGEKFKKDDIEYEITGYTLKDTADGRVEMVYFINTIEDSRAMHNSECMWLKPFLEEFGRYLPSNMRLIEELRRENELTQLNAELQYKLFGVMQNIDEFLEGDELKQPEVHRAATMREKFLRMIESLRIKPKGEK